MGKLAGKVAVITGGSSGLALETARLFVDEGAYVFITGRKRDALDDAVKRIGRNITGVQGDADAMSTAVTQSVESLRGSSALLSRGAAKLGGWSPQRITTAVVAAAAALAIAAGGIVGSGLLTAHEDATRCAQRLERVVGVLHLDPHHRNAVRTYVCAEGK